MLTDNKITPLLNQAQQAVAEKDNRKALSVGVTFFL